MYSTWVDEGEELVLKFVFGVLFVFIVLYTVAQSEKGTEQTAAQIAAPAVQEQAQNPAPTEPSSIHLYHSGNSAFLGTEVEIRNHYGDAKRATFSSKPLAQEEWTSDIYMQSPGRLRDGYILTIRYKDGRISKFHTHLISPGERGSIYLVITQCAQGYYPALYINGVSPDRVWPMNYKGDGRCIIDGILYP